MEAKCIAPEMTVPRLTVIVALLAASCGPSVGVPGGGGGSAPSAPRFAVGVQHVTAASLGRSWHAGCPVSPAGLRLVTASAWGFDGRPYRGRLIVNRDAVPAVSRVMRRLFALHYPIRRMRPVSAYGADDHRSMAADNTSAFNCRFVSGTTRWSQHAYGRAIDLNPLWRTRTSTGITFAAPAAPLRRSARWTPSCLAHDGGNVVRAFAAVGWGGRHWGDAPGLPVLPPPPGRRAAQSSHGPRDGNARIALDSTPSSRAVPVSVPARIDAARLRRRIGPYLLGIALAALASRGLAADRADGDRSRPGRRLSRWACPAGRWCGWPGWTGGWARPGRSPCSRSRG